MEARKLKRCPIGIQTFSDIIEIKLNKSAEEAMEQIELKQYDKRFALLNLPVVKVGVNFSTEARNIPDWTIPAPRK